MRKQQIQLIRHLKENDEPITSASLANLLDISPRSVKTYITEINDMLPGTIDSSRKGYLIDKEKAEQLLEEEVLTADEQESLALLKAISL